MKGRLVALAGLEKTEIQEYDLPEVEPGAGLLKVRRANVCGSDLHIYHHLSVALRDIVMGHEFVAEIEQLGAGLTTDSAGAELRVGDRVVVVYFYTCHRCAACDRGDFAMCLNSMRSMALRPETAPHFHGAFATHFYLPPGQYFYKVPDDLDDAEVAGANCGLAQVMFALDKMGLGRGQTVVVQGAGGLGLYAAALAKTSGARVIVVEGEPARVEAARRFGADDVVDFSVHRTAQERAEQVAALTGGRGADLVLEVTGRAEAFLEAIEFARIGGGIASVGNLNVGERFQLTFAPALLTRKQLRVHGYLRYDPWYLRKALEFLQATKDRFPFASLSDRVYTIDEIDQAIARSESRDVARAAVVPG
ncbi:zinc-binding dehydrogenase [uncultured Jatrophihabitans sp.]|uniref:zinc-binding dehydrogenase n=1 Tax=uncultured Jatrophihabitans sp. TaxID=1610747 RepID=UPI0035CA26B4